MKDPINANTGTATPSRLYPRLRSDELLTADRNFYSFRGGNSPPGTGPPWHGGTYLSVLIDPKIRGADRRVGILDTARNGGDLEPGTAHLVRVIEYNVIDREGNGTGEVIVLLTNIVEPGDASAGELAAHNR